MQQRDVLAAVGVTRRDLDGEPDAATAGRCLGGDRDALRHSRRGRHLASARLELGRGLRSRPGLCLFFFSFPFFHFSGKRRADGGLGADEA